MEAKTIAPQEHRASQIALGVAESITGGILNPETVSSDPAFNTVASYPWSGTLVLGTKILSDAPPGLLEKGVGVSDVAITMNPSKLDTGQDMGDPKIVLKDGSKIFYYDIHMVPDGEEPEEIGWSARSRELASNRFIAVSTNTGVRFLVRGGEFAQGQSIIDDNVVAPGINSSVNNTTRIKDLNGGKQLLERLGYLFVNDQVYAPSPETFKKYCEQEGIEIELTGHDEPLGTMEFLDACERGVYPVSSGEMKLFLHDISDGHITAILLGGKELQAAVSSAIKTALANGYNPHRLTGGVDMFTELFRDVILPVPNNGYELHDEADGVVALKDGWLPIPDEKIDELIAIAQQRARDFGLEPTDPTK